MKITTRSAVPAAMLAGLFLASSCASDIETDVNPDPQGNSLNFTASVGSSSRAEEINIDNLGDFAVMARGMHPDGVLYDSYLIGSAAGGGEIAHFTSMSTDGTKGTWNLDRKVYWPETFDQVLFIGWTTLKRGADGKSESSAHGVLPDGAAFGIVGDKPSISGFNPLKADLSATPANGIWADGAGQKDLVIAFKQEKRSPQSTVALNFRHALTQVSIVAGQKDKDEATDHRIVKVKGAWLVNAAKYGTLTATIDATTKPAQNSTAWTATGTETYGSYYNDIITLAKDGKQDLLRNTLMLVPQSLTAWDYSSATTTGAYIMLLCRVELEHDGTTHTGSNITDIAIAGGKHYHQLFPVNETEYNGSQYGFVCVPVSTDWADRLEGKEDSKGAGMHYTYALDICGMDSGAGVYPPIPVDWNPNALIPSGATVMAYVLKDGAYSEQEVALDVVTDRHGKNIGDAVLDEPIKFSVTVDAWKNPDQNWTDGSLTM